MRTTIDIPDVLFREAKAKAALEGLTLRELVIEGLQYRLEEGRPQARALHRAKFPIVKSRRGIPKITSDSVSKAVEQLYREEADYYAQFVRR